MYISRQWTHHNTFLFTLYTNFFEQWCFILGWKGKQETQMAYTHRPRKVYLIVTFPEVPRSEGTQGLWKELLETNSLLSVRPQE